MCRFAFVCVVALAMPAILCAQSADDLRQKRLPLPSESHAMHSRTTAVPPAEVPLRVPEGFAVKLYADGLTTPREMVQLPNGDVLAVESKAGRITRLRDGDGDGTAETRANFVAGLKQPYGILFRDGFVYVANTDAIVRFAVDADGKAGTREEVIPKLEYAGQSLGGMGHWTRDVLFSRDGKRLYVSVGSQSNNDEDPAGRAAILEYADGSPTPRLFATGLRNPVSIALRPGTDEIWTTVNERDRLGDDLVPDYVTSVKDDGFYGWPYFYIGTHRDPRYPSGHDALAARVITPDVLIQSHSAPLGVTFYEADKFPPRLRGAAFVGLHGSWNRQPLVGYKVVAIPFKDGKAGDPEDFLTGFVKDPVTGEVYGRPVAPYVLKDGSLLVSDDTAGRIWRIVYSG